MIGIQKIKNKQGFTILELIISMTLFAIITTSVLLAVESLSINRIKTLNRVALLEELYFFSEQLFTGIKEGGTLDYEEYWNRQSVDTTIYSGRYQNPTGVGNYGLGGGVAAGSSAYGSGIYLCRSNIGATNMGSGGCLANHNNGSMGNLSGAPVNFSGGYQRYGQYAAQFTDYNGNADADLGDEDGAAGLSIIGDDDDRSIGDVPEILTGSMQELYLINKNAKRRTYFRWKIQQDPNAILSGALIPCIIDTTTVPGKTTTGSGCMGNVQMLKLQGLDVGLDHSGSTTDKTAYDGIIDTWICTESDQCVGPPVSTLGKISTGKDPEWFDLFPASINVKNLSFRIFPVKDPWKSWAAPDAAQSSSDISPFIHPYVRMNLEMGFSWGKRRVIKNEDPTISISTSVSLSDFE